MTGTILSNVQDFLHTQDLAGNGELAYGLGGELPQNNVLYDYPARMVNKLQGDLLDAAARTGYVTTIADPFMGSGTILYESMLRGLDFVGQDINPLSYLLCSLYEAPLEGSGLTAESDKLLARIRRMYGTAIAIDSPGLDKWFGDGVQVDLSRIRRGIQATDDADQRRFFWVCLAETVRLVSNSRQTTYKLHIRSPENLAERDVDATLTFERVVQRNLLRRKEIASSLKAAGHLREGTYTGRIGLTLGDVQDGFTVGAHKPDVLMSSPPYGDNRTTITYGQHSFYPLQWIDLNDLGVAFNKEVLANPYRLDGASLGGRIRHADDAGEELLRLSPALKNVAAKLKKQPKDRLRRVLAFSADLRAALQSIEARMQPETHGFWTVGNRCVGGVRVPMDDVLLELSKQEEVLRFHRNIPRKRMPARNASAETMLRETILLTRFA